MYPNPTSNSLNVELEKASPVTLYTITGSKIKESASKNVHHIDVSALPIGMYFIQVGDKTLKFIKQ
jgi:hypothetical protein